MSGSTDKPRQPVAASATAASRASARTDPDAVHALVRGFDVLDCLASATGPLGNAEVARCTGIPRPTVSRILATLVRLGHARESADGRYELAAGVVRLAQAFLGAIDVREQARPHLRALAEACSASAFLAVRDADDMLVVEAARSRSAVALLGSDVGTRMSVATSSLGRAWLAGVEPALREAVVHRLRQGTSELRAVAGVPLERAVAEALTQGVAISLGEWHPNIHAAAVAVCTPAGEVVAINCGGPAFLMPEQRLRDLVIPRLRETADAIAVAIGGRVVPPRAQEPEPVSRAGRKSHMAVKASPATRQETPR